MNRRKPEATILLTSDDDSTGSDTLCDSESSEDDKSTTNSSISPTKTVAFNLPEEKVDMDKFTNNVEEILSQEGCRIQSTTPQNDEVDARLVHTAWLRKTSDCIYMSNRKSMSLKAYIHTAHRRTEAPTLLDLGATKNFMNLIVTIMALDSHGLSFSLI